MTTTYVYTALGNVFTANKQAPNTMGGATVTTTYNYTSDPGDSSHGVAAYSQAEALGQPLTVTDPLGHVTHLRWNAQGQLAALIDALGDETDYTYNPADDQIAAASFPATGQTGSGRAYFQYLYDHTGGTITAIAAYDESGKMVRQVNLNNGNEGEAASDNGSVLPVGYTQDGRFRLTQITDGNNNPAQKYAYDPEGNLGGVTYPLGDGTTFKYDADGNTLSRLTGRGTTITYTLAPDDARVTGVGYNDGTPGVGYQYDQYDRVTQMTDGSGMTVYSYDDDDDLLSTTSSFTNGPQNKAVSYTYNADGSRATMTVPFGTFTYTSDNAGRVTSVRSPWTGGGYSYTYDDADRLTQQQFSKAITTYIYNQRDQLTSLQNLSTFPGYGIFSKFSNVKYDALGNRTTLAATIPPITFIDGSNRSYVPDASRGLTYGYDSVDQLAAESSNPLDNTAFSDSYNYGFGTDGAGNLTTIRNQSVLYDTDNRDASLSYDGDGNPTTYRGYPVSYDAEDRITQITGLLTAGFTGGGRRAWKGDASGSNRTFFLYDGGRVVEELTAGGILINTYGYGPGGLVQRYIHSLPGYIGYTFDAQGTLVQRHRQVDSFVASADTAIYDALGQLDADLEGHAGGAFTSHDSVGYLGQSGHYTDPETAPIAAGGMLSVGGDYYDMRAGRYVTRGSDVNGYVAAANSWVNYVDWLGVAQQTVDTAGLVPGLNVPASLLSAGLSASRGDYAGVGLSLLAVVPFEGTSARLLKLAREAKSLDRGIVDAGETVAQSSYILRQVPGAQRGFAMIPAGKKIKTLNELLKDDPELLQEATNMHNKSPEWQGIDPSKTSVFYRDKDAVDAIRAKSGESGGHHPHGLALGGPEGQKLTPTGETRTWKNPLHSSATGLQRRIINRIKNK